MMARTTAASGLSMSFSGFTRTGLRPIQANAAQTLCRRSGSGQLHSRFSKLCHDAAAHTVGTRTGAGKRCMPSVAVVGAGAGGAAAVAELVAAGHEVRFWGRSPHTLAPFVEQGGVAYEGVLGSGLARPTIITCDLAAATDAADVVLVCLPTFAHADVARALARISAHGGAKTPVVLNPGHTGG